MSATNGTDVRIFVSWSGGSKTVPFMIASWLLQPDAIARRGQSDVGKTTSAGWWEGLDVVGNGVTDASIAQEMRF